MAFNPNFNPNCGACGGLNSRGYCSYTACRFPVTKVTVITNQQPKTNYDRLISKSPEKLAAWIADHPVVSEYDENNPKHKSWLDWLKSPAEEGDG